jgi:hypothetical protein
VRAWDWDLVHACMSACVYESSRHGHRCVEPAGAGAHGMWGSSAWGASLWARKQAWRVGIQCSRSVPMLRIEPLLGPRVCERMGGATHQLGNMDVRISTKLGGADVDKRSTRSTSKHAGGTWYGRR